MNNIQRFGSAVAVVALAVVLAVLASDGALAQERPDGTLVVVPQVRVDVGDAVDVVAMHVSPADQEVVVTYSAHLVPAGEPCPPSLLAVPAATPRSLAPITMSMVACSYGTASVQLVAADTGYIISEKRVDISPPPTGAVAQAQADPTIDIDNIDDTSLDVGDSTTFDVEADNLDGHTVVVSILNRSLSLTSNCRTLSVEEEDLTGSFSDTYRAYACQAPGSQLFAYVNDEDGNAVVGTSISGNTNRIGVRPVVSFEDDEYDADEGDEIQITVELIGGNTSYSPDIPIDISGGGHDEDDADGLNNDDELEFSSGSDEESFTIEIQEDSDCDDETITVEFGSLPSNIGSGDIDEAEITVEDDDNNCGPTVQFADDEYDVDEDEKVTITVRLSEALDDDVDIPIRWDNRSAGSVSGLSSRNLEIEEGDRSATFDFTAADDDDCDDEDVTFYFGSLPGDLREGDNDETVVTVDDDDTGCTTDPGDGDTEVYINVSPSSITEGGVATFTVTATDDFSSPTTVPLDVWITGDVHANRPPSRVVIPRNGRTASFTVSAARDTKDEPDGGISVGIRKGSGYVLGSPSVASLSLKDDDLPRISISAEDSTITEGRSTTFTVEADDPVQERVTVELSTVTSGNFFSGGTLPPARVTIASGTSTTFTVRTVGDSMDEPNGYITVSIDADNSKYRRGTSSARVNVNDNDLPRISISASDSTITEGDSTTFTVEAEDPVQESVTVELTTRTRGNFFSGGRLPPPRVTIASGTSTSFTVRTVDDTVDESDGYVTVSIDADSSKYRRGTSSARVNVTDDDLPKPTVTISVSPSEITEGDTATYTVNVSPATSTSLNIKGSIATRPVTSSRYSNPSSLDLVTVPANGTSATFTITPADDSTDNVDYYMRILVTSDPNNVYRVGRSPNNAAYVRVKDDDDSTVSFTQASYTAVEGGANATVEARLSTAAESTTYVSVTFRHTTGYTTSGLSSGRLRFARNSSRATFTVRFTPDDDCDDSSVRVYIDTSNLPSGITAGTRTSANIFLDDRTTGCAIFPDPPAKPTYTISDTTNGSVNLDWPNAARASRYHVLRYDDSDLQFEWQKTVMSSAATITGLDPNDEHTFKIRSVSRTQHTAESPETTVNLKPAPASLRAWYRSGFHRRLSLAWTPVPNADVAKDTSNRYHVEMYFQDASAWKRVTSNPSDNNGVYVEPTDTIGGVVRTVVRGLAPGANAGDGKQYRFRVRADSVQGLSEPSGEASADVLNESPTDAPQYFDVSVVIGNRGFEITWRASVRDADFYLIEVDGSLKADRMGVFDPAGSLKIDNVSGTELWYLSTLNISRGTTITLRAYGLNEGAAHTVSVWGANGSGNGPKASERITAPFVESLGHQADHNVKYVYGTIKDTEISGVIADAAKAWNTKMSVLGKGLTMCLGCTDNHAVTIEEQGAGKGATTSPPNMACGDSYACLEGTKSRGEHLENMTMIFENPPWYTDRADDGTIIGERQYEWTSNTGMHNRPKNRLDPNSIIYLSSLKVAMHEFGHTLSIHDFYLDSTMEHLDAIMNRLSSDITDHDIDQLRAIYYNHSKNHR